MLTVAAVVLTLACVVLTVSMLGLLRGVADLRLYITGRSPGNQSEMMLTAGLRLPERFDDVLAVDDRRRGVLLFVSESCGTCAELMQEMASASLPFRASISVVGTASDSFVGVRLPDQAHWLSPAIADDIADYLRVERTPVAVLHEDGFIVGSALGEGAGSLHALNRLWGASHRRSSDTDDSMAKEPT